MCLRTITKKYPKKNKEKGIGYKIFQHKDGKLYNWLIHSKKPLKEGRWIKAKKHRILTNWRESYTSGFHIFKHKKDAQELCNEYYTKVRKVKYRGINCKGTQLLCGTTKTKGKKRQTFKDREIIVAKEMLITRREKE